MQQSEIDILENDILEKYPTVLEILLRDHTTQQNIFWATDNYQEHGNEYQFHSQIKTTSITGANGHIVMPRVKKDKVLQQSRVREMAEVFTPSWICNAQNNLIDNVWFGRENVFNTEIQNANGIRNWHVNKKKIIFPPAKSWKDYVKDKRLEIACGEAPYLTSRYDTTTGEFIPIGNRVGILDRKLRVISENVDNTGKWLEAAQIAYKNTYAFEWQGDSLLLAREALLFAFIENYVAKFGKEPLLKSIQFIAYIISWNIWQMDGLKGVIPNSCSSTIKVKEDLFGVVELKTYFCEGCFNNDFFKHSGVKCIIKDWSKKDPQTGRMGRKELFIESLK
jgi:hypothetical protein